MDSIEISDHATMASGREAVEVVTLASLISALKLEMKGLKMSHRASALSVAKAKTGLKTNDRQKHIERLEVMLRDQKTKVLYLDTRKGGEDAPASG